MNIKSLVAFFCAVALMLPSAALAQSTDEGYGGVGGIAGQIDTGGPSGAPATTEEGENSLPFTGADLGVLAGAGGMLVLLGFGLRRLTHRPSEA